MVDISMVSVPADEICVWFNGKGKNKSSNRALIKPPEQDGEIYGRSFKNRSVAEKDNRRLPGG
jgi:hypothetical protein